MQRQQQEKSPSAACGSVADQIPTLDDYFRLMQRLTKFTTAQKAPTTQDQEEGEPADGGVLFTGWTNYGYWANGELLRGRP